MYTPSLLSYLHRAQDFTNLIVIRLIHIYVPTFFPHYVVLFVFWWFQNGLQVNARLLQQHISTSTGKLVTLRDIHNIRAQWAKAGTDEWTATVEELQKFQRDDPNAVVEVLVREATHDLEMIVLQTGEMKENLHHFPEVIQLDGTYGLNQSGFPLYALVVEDANGTGRLAALILTCAETTISIRTMLERVKAHNPSFSRTQVIIVDKDFAEVQAVKAVLPDAQIQLCVFHVLKAIRKELVKCVPKEAQREVYSIVHSLVYARNAKKFDDEWAKLASYEAFVAYMTTNWLAIKHWWVYYERMCHVNLGNGTNNRVESQFGKIKQVLSRKRRMNECIRLLLAVVRCADIQGRFQQFKNRYKVTYRNCATSAADGYFAVCTPYATKHIIDQMQKASADKYIIRQDGDVTNVENRKSKDVYSVQSNASTCTCPFFGTMCLPCRHILLVRSTAGLDIVDAQLVADRWKLSSDVGSMPVVSSSVQVLGIQWPASTRSLSKAEKYKAACKQLNKLCAAMSEVGMREFVSMTNFLSNVIERFESGKECILLDDEDEEEVTPDSREDAVEDSSPSPVVAPSSDYEDEEEMTVDSREDAVEDSSPSPVVTPSTAPLSPPVPVESQCHVSQEPVEVVVPLPSTAADNLDQENIEPLESVDEPVISVLEQSQLHSVSMPVKKCKRGRPKGTDKSLNVKFGTKRPKQKQAVAKAGPADVEATAVHLEVPGDAAHTELPLSERQATGTGLPQSLTRSLRIDRERTDDRCVECGRVDPPADINRSAQVDWIACDVCTYWYHKCCVDRKRLPKRKKERFLCSRCDS